jgi:hypothetical protein
MDDNLFKAAALLIILYAVYHLIRLIRNIVEASRKTEKDKKPESR